MAEKLEFSKNPILWFQKRPETTRPTQSTIVTGRRSSTLMTGRRSSICDLKTSTLTSKPQENQVKCSFFKEKPQPLAQSIEIKGRNIFEQTSYADAIYTFDVTKSLTINTKALLDYSKQNIKQKTEMTIIDTFEDRPLETIKAKKVHIEFDRKLGREDDLLYKQSEQHKNIRLENLKQSNTRYATCTRKFSFMKNLTSNEKPSITK